MTLLEQSHKLTEVHELIFSELIVFGANLCEDLVHLVVGDIGSFYQFWHVVEFYCVFYMVDSGRAFFIE